MEELVIGNTEGFVYASFQNLDLADGVYQVSVIAINELKMYSQKATTEFTLLTEPPVVTGLFFLSSIIVLIKPSIIKGLFLLRLL